MADGKYTWRGGFCLEVAPVPNTIAIFGASGDLSCRKLIPALFQLFKRGLLHEQSRIVGCARSELDDSSFHALLAKWIKGSPDDIREFLRRVHYVHGDFGVEL